MKPEQQRLLAALSTVVAGLPGEQEPLLDLPRFDPDLAVLARLREPAWRARAAAACPPAEADRLAGLLEQRWAALVQR
jgi:hypothetical protein